MFATTSIGSVIAHLLHGARRFHRGRYRASVSWRRKRLSLLHSAHRYLVFCFPSLSVLAATGLSVAGMALETVAVGTVAGMGTTSGG
jgi:hypothetical protein